LRLLDCKVEGCQTIKEGAPILTDFLCPECQNHKRQVSQILAQYNIDATWNPRLVRGLDYYTGIVFEVKYPFKETVFDLLGGGRYDQVIEQLGGARRLQWVSRVGSNGWSPRCEKRRRSKSRPRCVRFSFCR
ncbi:MAG TPA: ATP phosphoribosyltransferase regulatory subunit, partial [Thermotogota bacterium]|nr:ATP phosphoribosyltransferase regulatory subunit [Thermotogota bacterium]